MMSLVDGRAQEFDRGLTRASGLYQLVTELPGRYRVRADRIGYATTWSDYFDISAGDTIVVDVVARVEAISWRGSKPKASAAAGCAPRRGSR